MRGAPGIWWLSCRCAAMNTHDNPYRDDPELAPLTRTGRFIECAFAVVLAFLAVYLSK